MQGVQAREGKTNRAVEGAVDGVGVGKGEMGTMGKVKRGEKGGGMVVVKRGCSV